MTEKTGRTAPRARDIVYLFLVLLITWLMLTSSLHWQEVATGALLSLALALFLVKSYARLELPPFSITRLWRLGVFFLVLLVEVVKANIDVAYRVLHPRLPINPGIVIITTELSQDVAKVLLANSITLTPGTFTLDIQGDKLLIHWINVRSEDTAEATRLIAGRFEKHLKAVFA
jgi:multicomponent Na+:H+ antiporter subunit E